jgi:diamine N-acetyltransferase
MPFLVELREITDENRRAVEGLRVSVRQEQFVASVAESLEEAESSSEAHPWYRAIYADGSASS